MNFESLQQAWQRQPLPAPADPTALAHVRAEAEKFDRTIWRRDRREIAAALFCVVTFGLFGLYRGWSAGWAHWFAAVESAAIAGYFIYDRRRQARIAARFDDSLLGQIDRAIFRTAHQVRLLRSIFAWYLAPFLLTMLLLHVQDFGGKPWAVAWPLVAKRLLFEWLFAGLVYWLNQRAVRRELQPRLAELRRLRAGFAPAAESSSP